MDFKLELVLVPVSDVDAANTFYIAKAGFTLDVVHRVSDELRIVQPTPPGSACLTTASGSSGHGPRAWPNSGPGCGQDIYIVHGQDSAPHERREAVEYPHPVRSAPHAVVTVQQLLEHLSVSHHCVWILGSDWHAWPGREPGGRGRRTLCAPRRRSAVTAQAAAEARPLRR